MAVSEQTPYQEFIANGTSTVFPLNFDAKEQDHLIVLVDDVEPQVGEWSFDFNTDQVTFLKAPKANSVIKIRRDTPLKRDSNYQTYNNSFRPEPVNEDLDSIWYKLQEMGVLNWMVNNDIKDLGAYVDSLNDETKAAFLAMIEKQGVSMQQLDLYVQGLYKKLANVAVEKGWLAEFIADKTGKNQQQINDDQKDINNNVLKNFENTIVITPEISNISSILNNAPPNTEIIIKNGEYTASEVKIEKDNVIIKCQSRDVKITVTAGATGIFMRFGKRGPDSDTRSDNLPVYNGTITNWDEQHFSPSLDGFPRYKNLGIQGGTIILSNKNGTGVSTGIDFYRVDNPVLDAKVEWESKFNFGNGVRVFFCKDMQSPYLEIDDNENSTFTMLYFWSYGLNADIWKIGRGSERSIDFKHTVNGFVNHIEAYGNKNAASMALNLGYGSLNNRFGKMIIRDGICAIRSAVEFDCMKGVVIDDLDIDNEYGEGLKFVRAVGVDIRKYKIRAKAPISLATELFYMFSNATGITPIQSSSEFMFDGNYRTTAAESGYTKYFEKRPVSSLSNSKFGKGELIATVGATYIFLSNVAGGVADMMTGTGKLRRFEKGVITKRGHLEDHRCSFDYEYTSPHSIDSVDFGDMSLKYEDLAYETLIAAAQFSVPIDKCSGTIRTFLNKKSLHFIWMFDSDINLITNRYLTTVGAYIIEMSSMIRSKIRGKWLASGRVVNFTGGSTLYYTDGYDDHVFSGTIIRPSNSTASPPFVTNYTASVGTWQPVQFENMKIYSEDLTTLLADNAVIRHLGSLPLGVTDASGGGYVSKSCVMDRNIPFRRYFTDSNAAATPPYKPNFVGELAQNGTSDTWWEAISLTAWGKL